MCRWCCQPESCAPNCFTLLASTDAFHSLRFPSLIFFIVLAWLLTEAGVQKQRYKCVHFLVMWSHKWSVCVGMQYHTHGTNSHNPLCNGSHTQCACSVGGASGPPEVPSECARPASLALHVTRSRVNARLLPIFNGLLCTCRLNVQSYDDGNGAPPGAPLSFEPVTLHATITMLPCRGNIKTKRHCVALDGDHTSHCMLGNTEITHECDVQMCLEAFPSAHPSPAYNDAFQNIEHPHTTGINHAPHEGCMLTNFQSNADHVWLANSPWFTG